LAQPETIAALPYDAGVHADPVLDSHPNVVRKGPVYLAFTSVLVAGAFGAMIGYGLVAATCSETPAKLRQLLASAVPGYAVPTHSCQAQLAGATILGAVITAVGAGIVARLVLRAMTDWKKTPPKGFPT
jgi:hypothetical protein